MLAGVAPSMRRRYTFMELFLPVVGALAHEGPIYARKAFEHPPFIFLSIGPRGLCLLGS